MLSPLLRHHRRIVRHIARAVCCFATLPALALDTPTASREALTITSGQETEITIPVAAGANPVDPLRIEISPPPTTALRAAFGTFDGSEAIVLRLQAAPAEAQADPVTWTGTMAVYDAAGLRIGEQRIIMMHAPDEAVDHPRSAWSKRAWWWFVGHGLLLCAMCVGGYSILRRRPWWWKRRLPHARLVPLDVRTRTITAPQDLRVHCVKHNRLRLLVGMDAHCHIQLANDDVQQRHVWITMLPDRTGGATTRLIPIGDAVTTVNGERLDKARTLQDGDEVSLGALRFVFQLAEHYRPVVVEYRDGSRATGFPLTWDTLHPAFRFRDSSAAVSEGGTAISFADVRAVHFVADWDESVCATLPTAIPYPRGKRAILSYEDGSEAEGWLTPDYEPSAKRFHFLPEPPAGVIVSLVEREAIQHVTLVETDPR